MMVIFLLLGLVFTVLLVRSLFRLALAVLWALSCLLRWLWLGLKWATECREGRW